MNNLIKAEEISNLYRELEYSKDILNHTKKIKTNEDMLCTLDKIIINDNISSDFIQEIELNKHTKQPFIDAVVVIFEKRIEQITKEINDMFSVNTTLGVINIKVCEEFGPNEHHVYYKVDDNVITGEYLNYAIGEKITNKINVSEHGDYDIKITKR